MLGNPSSGPITSNQKSHIIQEKMDLGEENEVLKDKLELSGNESVIMMDTFGETKEVENLDKENITQTKSGLNGNQNTESDTSEGKNNCGEESEHFEDKLQVSAKEKETVMDSSSDEEVNSLEELRARNIKRMAALISSLRNPEMEKQIEDMKKNMPGPSRPFKSKQLKKRNKNYDAAVRFNVKKPLELRKSLRLRNQKPEYQEEDLNEIEESIRKVYFKRPNYDVDAYFVDDLEKVVYQTKPRRSTARKTREERVIPVKVTQAMLDNIALKVSIKVYSHNGTSCHQCRQKTLDQKTYCRNPECVGVQGSFCGVCIKNRYGEDCAEALLNPKWICPVCRGKCNCSICRSRQGKRPTGVLTPLALENGYESVDHFLGSLNGEGDIPGEDHKWTLLRDPEALLGFSDNGRKAHSQDGRADVMFCGLCAVTDCEKSENLLGFFKDGTPLMGAFCDCLNE